MILGQPCATERLADKSSQTLTSSVALGICGYGTLATSGQRGRARFDASVGGCPLSDAYVCPDWEAFCRMLTQSHCTLSKFDIPDKLIYFFSGFNIIKNTNTFKIEQPVFEVEIDFIVTALVNPKLPLITTIFNGFYHWGHKN